MPREGEWQCAEAKHDLSTHRKQNLLARGQTSREKQRTRRDKDTIDPKKKESGAFRHDRKSAGQAGDKQVSGRSRSHSTDDEERGKSEAGGKQFICPDSLRGEQVDRIHGKQGRGKKGDDAIVGERAKTIGQANQKDRQCQIDRCRIELGPKKKRWPQQDRPPTEIRRDNQELIIEQAEKLMSSAEEKREQR